MNPGNILPPYWGGGKDCNGGDEGLEGVIVQYSNDAGVRWHMLGEQLHSQYGEPR